MVVQYKIICSYDNNMILYVLVHTVHTVHVALFVHVHYIASNAHIISRICVTCIISSLWGIIMHANLHHVLAWFVAVYVCASLMEIFQSNPSHTWLFTLPPNSG